VTVTSDSLFLSAADLLPDGIRVDRDVFAGRCVWVVYDRRTRLAARVEVDPDDYLVDWEPPPKMRWWRWLSPLGAALDAADRAHEAARMRGRQVVDWGAVERESKRVGEEAIWSLLQRREPPAPEGRSPKSLGGRGETRT
jgi:hypothetical protein